MKTNPILILFLVVPLFWSYSQKNKYVQVLPNSDFTIEMVPVTSGEFKMGSPNNEVGRENDEGPQRDVKIEGFWMASKEITWNVYHLFLERSLDNAKYSEKGQEVSITPDAVSGATIPYVDMSLGMGTGKNLPVGNITQLGASKFCEWLSAVTGNFYRLPTEAEWEYAARAGSSEPYFFSENDSLSSYAWYSANSNETYHKVGQKKPNPWGLYDIYGNVAEWTLDQYVVDAYEKKYGQFVPVKKEFPAAVRGGSYKDGPKDLRSASRQASKPVWKQRDPQFPKSKWWNTDAPFVGFRIVRPYKTPDKENQDNFWLKK
ncbi:formylglycine-generating enzyme family protein [Maribacter sp. 2210JD10-5]|uniref:formylglycine-generating enzyme family protein n=1 Tax=Maribacter sp. 2210JD10-5 TaxID=3386272 RepID=UPI0039BC73A5